MKDSEVFQRFTHQSAQVFSTSACSKSFFVFQGSNVLEKLKQWSHVILMLSKITLTLGTFQQRNDISQN